MTTPTTATNRNEAGRFVVECRHPSIHPADPWPDGPAWACDRCGQPFSPAEAAEPYRKALERLERAVALSPADKPGSYWYWPEPLAAWQEARELLRREVGE